MGCILNVLPEAISEFYSSLNRTDLILVKSHKTFISHATSKNMLSGYKILSKTGVKYPAVADTTRRFSSAISKQQDISGHLFYEINMVKQARERIFLDAVL